MINVSPFLINVVIHPSTVIIKLTNSCYKYCVIYTIYDNKLFGTFINAMYIQWNQYDLLS